LLVLQLNPMVQLGLDAGRAPHPDVGGVLRRPCRGVFLRPDRVASIVCLRGEPALDGSACGCSRLSARWRSA
jgi:hypothetical protein